MTIPQLFFNQAARLKENRALIFKDKVDDSWHEISWLEFSRRVKLLAAYLSSIGIKKGDRVMILSENRPEWAISDLAVLSLGAVSVPAYFTNTSGQIDYIIRDSGSKAAIVSTVEQLEKVLAARSARKAACPVKKIVIMESPKLPLPDGILTLSQIFGSARGLSDRDRREMLDKIDESDTASILYTSGTTGEPKGVLLSHKNFLSNASACLKVVEVGEEDTFLSFLPLSHAFERTVGYYVPLASGAAIAYAESVDKLPQNIKDIRPTIILGVPRFYEKTYSAILDAVNKGPRLKRYIFNRAFAVGLKSLNFRRISRPLPALHRLKEKIASILVFSKIREKLGGRLRFFISGGAPLSPDILDFFDALGIVILEGYGLTETSPVITCNTIEYRKRATVGKPLPGVEVKILQDGEIITRGDNIMKGYYNNDGATTEIIKKGWFHTGDIGILDEEGYLSITDRKKDIIVTSGGKNVSPQSIESALIVDPLIKQVMVYGDRRKYLTAIIVPDTIRLEKMAEEGGFSPPLEGGFIKDSRIVKVYSERIDDLQKNFAPYEKIKRFVLLNEEFSMDRGEITPTLKLNRRRITKRYEAALDDLYKNEWELDRMKK